MAGDRHHHLASEIRPALATGKVVLCDRYVPSSLVLQRMDGLSWDVIIQLNAGTDQPGLAVILNGDPDVIRGRLAARGGHSRFERPPGSTRETRACASHSLRWATGPLVRIVQGEAVIVVGPMSPANGHGRNGGPAP